MTVEARDRIGNITEIEERESKGKYPKPYWRINLDGIWMTVRSKASGAVAIDAAEKGYPVKAVYHPDTFVGSDGADVTILIVDDLKRANEEEQALQAPEKAQETQKQFKADPARSDSIERQVALKTASDADGGHALQMYLAASENVSPQTVMKARHDLYWQGLRLLKDEPPF